MGRAKACLWGWALLLLIPAGAPGRCSAEEPTVSAFCREGQTFITWTELVEVSGERYAIYRCARPVTAATLADAQRLAVVDEDSGAFASEKGVKVLAKKTKMAGYGQRFIIHDNPTNDPKAQVPEGVGLFVLTVKAPGRAYYAVVPVVEGKDVPGRLAALTKPVEEKVGLPGAVLVWKHPGGTAAVYTHWMDGVTWDPLTEGRAYNFGVGVPTGYNGTDPLPVMFYGHGMGGTYRAPERASYWRCLWVWPGDRSGTWFFGMMNREKTKVVNYVEQRIRWMAAWVKAGRANQFWKANPRLVQAHGHSMGGTMCNALALRMGDVFCSTISSSGATIHRRNRVWVGHAEHRWGTIADNLPVAERFWRFGPDRLTITERPGTGVWDWQDYARWSLDHVGTETAFLLISNGKRDGSVVFEPVPDFLDALQTARRPFAAHWDMRGHSNNFAGVSNERLGRYQLPIDESLPALAHASNNDDPRKDPTGLINGYLEWSASGNDFDKKSTKDDLVDTVEMWAINIRSLKGAATVDVTPRRLQRFKPVSGTSYLWENIDCSDPKSPRKVGSGTVTADRYGLVTVRAFAVSAVGWGSRLIIRPAR